MSKNKSSLEREDVLLLLVAVGDVAVAVGQVEQRLIVVGRGGVLGVLVETHLPFVQHAVQVDPWPAVVWEGGRCEGRESEGGGEVEGRYTEKVGRWWLRRGETGGVRESCRVAPAKLTPHSPDQSRQVGRRDGPAPRGEEETHCWTSTNERTDRRTDGRRRWGMEGWEGGYVQFGCLRVGLIYDLPWRRREEQPGASRERGEKRESLVKWHFGNNTTLSHSRHAASPLWACLHAHSIPVKSWYPSKGIIQNKLSVCSFISWFQIPLTTNTT